MSLEIGVLGPLEVHIDGQRHDVPGAIRQRLLLRLLLSAGRVVPRHELVECAWADRLPNTWAATLRMHLTELRKLLPPSSGLEIRAEESGYRLVLPNDASMDVLRFEAGMQAAFAASAPRVGIERFDEALRFWRGRPWATILRVTAASADAQRLESLRFDGLTRLAELLLGEGDYDRVLGTLDFPDSVLMSQTPLCELRMRALVAMNQVNEATEFYRRISGLFIGVGLEPPLPLTHAYEAIVLAAGLASAPTAEFPAGLQRRGTFIGRHTEMNLLAVDADASTPGAIALVHGPGGIGKSRLAAELARRAFEAGALVLHGWADGDGKPFSLIDEAFRSWATVWREPGVDRADFIESLLRHVTATRPVLVVLDDLHLADLASTKVLRKIARRGLPHGVRILITLRDESLTPAVELLRRELLDSANTRICPLTGLTEFETEHFVRHRVGHLRPAAIWQMAQRLHHHLDGNPLLMELAIENGGDSQLSVERLDVTDLIEPALAAMPQRTHDALVLVSLLSGPVTIQLLADLLLISEPEAAEALEPALQRGVLLNAGDGRFRFRHHLVRWAIERDWSPTYRARAHHQIAEVLQRWPHVDPLELARHRCEALLVHDPPEVVAGIIDEAESAIGRLDWDGAAALLDRLYALAANKHAYASDPAWVFRTNLVLANALDGSADTGGARIAYRRAVETARDLGDPIRYAQAAIASAGNSQPLDGDPERMAWLAEAFAQLPPEHSELRLATLAELVYLRAIAGVEDTLLALLHELEQLAERRGDPVSRAMAAHGRLLAMIPGSEAEALYTLARQARGWAEGAAPEIAATAALASCYAALELGRLDDAMTAIEDLDALVAKRQRPGDRWLIHCLRSTLADWHGDFAVAEAEARLAKQIGDRHEVHSSADAWLGHGFSVAWQQNSLGSFEFEDSDLAATSSASGSALEAAFALVLIAQGSRAEAHGLAESALAIVLDQPRNELWLPAACIAAAAAAAVDADRRRELFHELAGHHHLIAVVGLVSVSTFGPVSRYRGLLAESLGMTEQARACFADAVATCERAGLTSWAHHARADLQRSTGALAPTV